MKAFQLMSFFFFQAEDGIRDLVRSRGLGDVYKRQVIIVEPNARASIAYNQLADELLEKNSSMHQDTFPVSYTHLTLPTSDLV